MKKIYFALFLCILVGGIIGYAASPAVFPNEFSYSKIVQFSSSEKSHSISSPPNFLKFVTYNIGYASGKKNNLPVKLSEEEVKINLNQIAEELKKFNPDIIALQEVDFNSDRTHHINQFEYLAKALQMPYGAYALTWNKRYLPWPYWPPRIQYGKMVSGQAVLSRFPIEHQSVFDFSKPSENPFWYNWFYLDRLVQKVRLKIGYDPIYVWNVHLEAFKPNTRLTQATLLGEWVQLEPNAFKIVMGDFNSVSHKKKDLSPEQQKAIEDKGEAITKFTQMTSLKNAEAASDFLSIPSWDPLKKIDHIFYQPDSWVELSSGNLEGIQASDHLPIWSFLKMQK